MTRTDRDIAHAIASDVHRCAEMMKTADFSWTVTPAEYAAITAFAGRDLESVGTSYGPVALVVAGATPAPANLPLYP